MERTKTTAITVLAVALAATLAVSAYNSQKLKHRITVAESNLAAITDTARHLRLSNGKLVEWNQALTVEKDGLDNLLRESELSKKEIERTLGSKIDRLSKIVSSFKSDTIVVTDTVEIVSEGVFSAPFEYSDEYTGISGTTQFTIHDLSSKTTIEHLCIRIPMTLGMTEDSKVFASTENPNARIELMNNIVVDKKEYNRKRIGIGLYTGFGVTYGLTSKSMDAGPQAGIGVYWRLL